MSLLLTLFLLSPGRIDYHQDQPSARIFVAKQQKFKNRGHHPENNRRVIFRMVNDSSQPLIVYGTKFDDGEFEPTGYLIELDKTTAKWVYPNPDNAPMPWSAKSDLDKEKYILQPGKSISFEAEMSMVEAGRHFKRTVYVSFKEGEEPTEIRGEEFILK